MKQRHVAAERANARAILAGINASIGQSFYTLSAAQVCDLLTAADLARYRAPRNANGSRGRYFYALLQRRATRADAAGGPQAPASDAGTVAKAVA